MWQGLRQTGLACVTAVAGYENGRVRRHELTTPVKETDRVNQIDLRFSKILRTGGRSRLDLNVDLYNAFNSDAILTQQNAFTSAWRLPLSVIQPRFVKFSARWDF